MLFAEVIHWKIQLLGKNLVKTSPKAWEAETIPVMKPNAVALFDESTTSA